MYILYRVYMCVCVCTCLHKMHMEMHGHVATYGEHICMYNYVVILRVCTRTEMPLWKTLGYILEGSGQTTGIPEAKIAYCRFSRVDCITSCMNSPSDNIPSKSPTRSILFCDQRPLIHIILYRWHV